MNCTGGETDLSTSASLSVGAANCASSTVEQKTIDISEVEFPDGLIVSRNKATPIVFFRY